MSTPRKERLVRCGAALPNGGRCTRPTEPGTAAASTAAVPRSADHRAPLVCSCEMPFVVGEHGSLTDDGAGPRCLICSKRPRSEAAAENGRPERAPRGLGDRIHPDLYPSSSGSRSRGELMAVTDNRHGRAEPFPPPALAPSCPSAASASASPSWTRCSAHPRSACR